MPISRESLRRAECRFLKLIPCVYFFVPSPILFKVNNEEGKSQQTKYYYITAMDAQEKCFLCVGYPVACNIE